MRTFFLNEVQITYMSMAEIDAAIADIEAELDAWHQQGKPDTPVWFRIALNNWKLLTEAWAERNLTP